MAKIVIIDDEASILNLIGQLSRRMGHEAHLFETGREGLAGLAEGADLLIVDLRIGDMSGLEIIQECRKRHPRMPVVMITGYSSVESAVEAMRLGAFDYLTKPFALEDLQKTILRALQPSGPEPSVESAPSLADPVPSAPLSASAGSAMPALFTGTAAAPAALAEVPETTAALSPTASAAPPVLPEARLTASASAATPAESPVDTEAAKAGGAFIIGESPQMKEVLKLVRRIADRDSPVLLEGEFGSGKQTIARFLHQASRRQGAPFKVLPCSSLPENLLEQELFGGGADGSAPSIFHRAEGGTVVIEEINVLPPRLQSLLEGFLEELSQARQQGRLPAELDFRFAATSSVPLEPLAREGKFREDLYYRISVIPMTLPPLRARRTDILPLARHFLAGHSRQSGAPRRELEKEAVALLINYSWPGNVGELRNAVERACAFADGTRIQAADLPPKLSQKSEKPAPDEGGEPAKAPLPVGTRLGDFIKKQERLFIRETLKFNDNSREKTASMLGVSIATLYRKMGLKLERRGNASALPE